MRPVIERDVPLAPYNTFGIAVRARHFARVESTDALRALREDPLWNDGPRLIIGGGSNLLFTRDFDGLVVHIASRGHEHLGDDGQSHLVAVEAGEGWDGFVRDSVRRGWPGLENLVSIPGSTGASPVQNIGAYGVELADRFAWLEAFDAETGRLDRLDAVACAFGYRDSVFKRALRERVIITRVAFRLPMRWEPRVDYADVRDGLSRASIARPTPKDVLDLVTSIRRDKLPDPAVIGNAGSFFKNPMVDAARWEALRSKEPMAIAHEQPDGRYKVAAAWLIDRCGWRGRSLPGSTGRAAVHERQALVLVNRGGASGAEVLALATAIRASVFERYDIEFEIEPLVV